MSGSSCCVAGNDKAESEIRVTQGRKEERTSKNSKSSKPPISSSSFPISLLDKFKLFSSCCSYHVAVLLPSSSSAKLEIRRSGVFSLRYEEVWRAEGWYGEVRGSREE